MANAKKRHERMDLKLVLLVITLVVVVVGLLLEPSKGSPSAVRYILSNLGQFLIIFLAALIARDGIKFFTLKSTLGKSLFFI